MLVTHDVTKSKMVHGGPHQFLHRRGTRCVLHLNTRRRVQHSLPSLRVGHQRHRVAAHARMSTGRRHFTDAHRKQCAAPLRELIERHGGGGQINHARWGLVGHAPAARQLHLLCLARAMHRAQAREIRIVREGQMATIEIAVQLPHLVIPHPERQRSLDAKGKLVSNASYLPSANALSRATTEACVRGVTEDATG